MKRRFLIGFGAVIVAIIGYFGSQFYWLNITDELPYRNLTSFGSSSGYIFFNVHHQDSSYVVVMPNERAQQLIKQKSEFLHVFYSLYMKEVIRHEMATSVNDSLFDLISSAIVDPKIVAEFKGHDLTKDKSIFMKDNYLRYDMDVYRFNAIVYTFIKSGTNCYLDDYSGATGVSL